MTDFYNQFGEFAEGCLGLIVSLVTIALLVFFVVKVALFAWTGHF